MAGIEDYLPTGVSLPSFSFLGNAPAGAPTSYQGLLTRRKIVESMLAGKRPYPKTIGEGITSIGEALGERRALSQLDEQAAAQQAQDAQTIQGLSGGAPPVPVPGVPAAPIARTSDATPAAPSDVPAAPALAYADASGNPAATPAPVDTTPDNTASVGSPAPGVPFPPPRPRLDRTTQNAEINANPALANRIRLMAAGEVGSNPAMQQIQIESALNRAITQGVPVSKALETYTGPRSGGYYPPQTFLRGMAGQDPLTAAMRGSDLGGQTLGFSPTGNASGGVASRGIASGRYGNARAIGTGPGAETYVTQDSPAHLARLAATRVPQNFPDSTPVASADQGDGTPSPDTALSFTGTPAPDARDAITQALLKAQQQPPTSRYSPDAVTLPPDIMSGNMMGNQGTIAGNVVPPAGSVPPDAIPFSNSSNVRSDIAGVPPPVQMAAAATGNPPIPTDIQPAPGGAGQALVGQNDLYKPPPRVLPTPPTLAQPAPDSTEGKAIAAYRQAVLAGNAPMMATLQSIIAPLADARNKQYAIDVDKFNKDYADTLALQKMDEEKRYSAAADTTALAKARFGLPAGAIAGPTSWPPGAPAPAPGPQVAQAGGKLASGIPVAPPQVLGTSQSPQRTGMPTPEPPPPGVPLDKWAETQTPVMAKNLEAAKTAQNQFNEAIDTLQQARSHPGRTLGVGALSNYATAIPGSDAAGFGLLMKQLQGKNFLQGFTALKDTGANARFTQLEAGKTEEAQARLGTAQSPKDFDKALNDLEDHLRAGMELAQRRVNQPVTAYRLPGDNSSYAPDVGQVGVRAGKPARYIGGNPHLDSSYQPVQ